MLDLIRLFVGLVADLFWSRSALEAEILVLRQQIVVLRRGKPTRSQFVGSDRWVLGWVCCLFPNACDALAIVRLETVVRWHRVGFRSYWREVRAPRDGGRDPAARMRIPKTHVIAVNLHWIVRSTGDLR
jgi:hypothetical protein